MIAVKPFSRTDRLNDEVRRVLAGVMETEIRDPRVGFVTVTEVEISRDLAVAKVYVTMAETEDPEDTMAGLQSAAGYLRKRLGEELRLRTVPEIRFLHDDSVDRGFRMDALLKKIAEERDGNS
ncbi:30S ribosome-binding factor RbfA [Gemmatimonadota bacterium]